MFSFVILFSFAGAVAADSDAYTDFINDPFYQGQFSSAQLQYLDTLFNEYQYFFASKSETFNDFILVFCNVSSIGFSRVETWNSPLSQDSFRFATTFRRNDFSSQIWSFDDSALGSDFVFIFRNDEGMFGIKGYFQNQVSSPDSRLMYSCNVNSFSSISEFSSFSGAGNVITVTRSGSIGNCDIIFGSTDANDYITVELYEESAPAVDDDRLQLYTLKDSGGNQNLVVDLTKFRYHTPAGTVTFSDIILNLDCDGSNVSFSLPASSSEVVDIYNYYNVAYSILTPYKVFSLDNFDNVFVSSVSFNLVTSTIGGVVVQAFNISCDYWLKKTVDPLAPEDIPDPEYSDPVVKDVEQVQDMRDSLEAATTSRPSAFSGEWVFLQDHPQVPSWASNYDFRVIRSLSQISQLVNVNVYNYYYDNNPNGLDWLHGSFNPRTFLDENRDFAYYDMIIISCYKADLVSDTTTAVPRLTYQNIELEGYLVFYSQRFYIKQQGITQQDIFLSSELSAQNAKAYYDYMKLKLDDFEAKTLFGLSNIIDLNKDGISWLQTINNKCNLLDSSLNSGSSSVVTAIENIPQPDLFDDSNIITSIDTGFLNLQNRMTYLFVPSFSWQAVNYTEYLDSLGILSVPFRFGSQALNGLENNYSSNFEFEIAAFNMPLPDGGSFRLWDQHNIDFNIVEAGLPGSLWSTLQNFFFWICVIAQSYYTYCHIFRKEGGDDLDL